MAKQAPKTLAEMRAAAYAAFDAHESDMKTNPEYKAVADAQQAKRDAAAVRAGRVR